jgi:hypothetical protein
MKVEFFCWKNTISTPQKLCGVYILDNGQATAYSNTIGHQTQQNWQ